MIGVHPHGVLPFGGIIALSHEFDGGFASTFPGIQFRTLAATFCFYVPLCAITPALSAKKIEKKTKKTKNKKQKTKRQENRTPFL